MSYAIVAEFQVKPGREEDFVDLMRTHSRNSVTKEDACLAFDCCRDEADPNRYILYEVYTHAGALDAHRETEHYRWWQGQVKDMVVPGADGRLVQRLTAYERVAEGAAG